MPTRTAARRLRSDTCCLDSRQAGRWCWTTACSTAPAACCKPRKRRSARTCTCTSDRRPRPSRFPRATRSPGAPRRCGARWAAVATMWRTCSRAATTSSSSLGRRPSTGIVRRRTAIIWSWCPGGLTCRLTAIASPPALAFFAGARARMFPISTGRPATLATSGMVASPQALASAAGADALRAGGSAVDAAIAAGAALSVIYPHMTSVGGDAFWLIYDARARRVRYLNGGGRAAKGASIDWFHARGMKEVPLRGFLPATLTVPGAVASWCAAHEEYGRLPLARDLGAAIGYARDGFPVTGRLARAIELHSADGALNASALAVFAPGGAAPRAGGKLVNRGLALVLQRIAEGGREGFYTGETRSEERRV